LWTGTSFITPPFAAMLPLVALSFLIGSAYLYGYPWQRSISNLDALADPSAASGLAAGGAVALGWGAWAGMRACKRPDKMRQSN